MIKAEVRDAGCGDQNLVITLHLHEPKSEGCGNTGVVAGTDGFVESTAMVGGRKIKVAVKASLM